MPEARRRNCQAILAWPRAEQSGDPTFYAEDDIAKKLWTRQCQCYRSGNFLGIFPSPALPRYLYRGNIYCMFSSRFITFDPYFVYLPTRFMVASRHREARFCHSGWPARYVSRINIGGGAIISESRHSRMPMSGTSELSPANGEENKASPILMP